MSMGAARRLSTIENLLKRPVVTAQAAKGSGVSTSLLHHYVKTGVLRRVGRGLYVSAEHAPKIDFEWEELVYSVLSIPGGVICYTTALILHGLSDEVARQYWIAIPHGTAVAKRPRARVVRMRNHDLGVTRMKIGEVEIPIYDLERTLVEAFRAASPDVAIRALKQAFGPGRKVKPNLTKMREYAKKLRVPIDPYLMAVTT